MKQTMDEAIEKIRNCYVIIDSQGNGDEDVKKILENLLALRDQELIEKIKGMKKVELPEYLKMGRWKERTDEGYNSALTDVSEVIKN